MRVICWIFSFIAAAFAVFAFLVARSDIQLGIAANAFFSAIALAGIASIIGRLRSEAK